MSFVNHWTQIGVSPPLSKLYTKGVDYDDKQKDDKDNHYLHLLLTPSPNPL